MAIAIADIIKNEEKKCNQEILDKVIELIGQNKSIDEILNEADLSLFDLSTYLEVAFYKTNYDPSIFVDKDKVTIIMKELETANFPSLKEIKNKHPELEYSEIRVVRGVYFRTKHFYQKKSKPEVKSNTNSEKPVQLSLFNFGLEESKTDNQRTEKLDISSVPFLLDYINTFETEHWKKVAIELFSKYVPRQFYILPASFTKTKHHETEQSVGEFDISNPKKLVKMGGKYYHSYRVYQELLKIIETDSPEIWDFNREKVKNYVYGNEYEPWEKDVMKLAALSHDIYSGGTEDDYNPNLKRMDKNHAHYHKTELKPLSTLVPEYEWEVYIKIVDAHMWKWDPQPNVKFHDGRTLTTAEECIKFYSEYRLIKNVELCDYFATQRSNDVIPRFKQTIETWFYIKKNLDITWDDLNQVGISEEEIRKAFANYEDSLITLIKLALGDKFIEMKNQSFLAR